MPSRQSGSPFGMFDLSKRSRAMVFRLFSLTLASMEQESAERYLKVISPTKASCLTRSMRIFWRDELGVSCKKEEKPSTEGIGLEGSRPHIAEILECSLSPMKSSVSDGRKRIFL